jgi:autotransporter adhesin
MVSSSLSGIAQSTTASLTAITASLAAVSVAQSDHLAEHRASISKLAESNRQLDASVTAVSSSLQQVMGSVSELSSGLSTLANEVTSLRGETRKGIAAVAAFGAMAGTAGGPGEIGVDVGVAGYKGQGALATSISYTTPGGIVVSGGVGFAGSDAAVVRLGLGWKIRLGVTASAPSTAEPREAVPRAAPVAEAVSVR